MNENTITIVGGILILGLIALLIRKEEEDL